METTLERIDSEDPIVSDADTDALQTLSPATLRESSLQIELHPASAAVNVLAEWSQFEQSLEACPLACTSEWTRLWLKHFGGRVSHQFAIGRDRGRVRGFVLLTQGNEKDGPFPVKTMHLGTAGEPKGDSVYVEYNGFCVQKAYRNQFYEAFGRQLQRMRGWDEIRLDGFQSRETDQFLDSYHASENVSQEVLNCHFHDLQAARQANVEAITQLGYSTRKTIRKNLKAYGDLQTEWAEDVEHAEHIFADLVRLHQQRWNVAGKAGCYASERFLRFHQDLIRGFLPTGQTALFRVKNGDDVIGCNHLLIDGRRVLAYQGGAATYEGKLSPGLILDYLCIEECLRRGYDAYDFLAWESHHKIRLSTDCATLVWSRLKRPRAKYVVVDTLRKLKHLLDTK